MYMPENYMDIKWQMIILVADVKDIKPKDSNKNSTSRKLCILLPNPASCTQGLGNSFYD